MEIAELHTANMKKPFSLLWLIVPLFYLVGAAGMQSHYREVFLLLTPYLLIASVVLLYVFRKDRRDEYSWFSITCIFLGFFIEVAGTNTGKIFGEYSYGATLGTGFFKTPLVIGLNWFIITVTCGAVAEYFTKRILPKILIAAMIAVLIDILIEPAAISLGYWTWENGMPGPLNFFSWFVFSVVLQSIAVFFDVRFDSTPAWVLFFSNLLFFGIINVFA